MYSLGQTFSSSFWAIMGNPGLADCVEPWSVPPPPEVLAPGRMKARKRAGGVDNQNKSMVQHNGSPKVSNTQHLGMRNRVGGNFREQRQKNGTAKGRLQGQIPNGEW